MTTTGPRGFSLIELLIAVAIVGILGSIAYPSYLEQVRQSRRSECAGGITSLANAMERHYTINGSYLGAAEGGANIGPPGIFATSCPIDGGDATYDLTVRATASTYQLQAAPTGAQAGDKCGVMTLTNTGQKGVEEAEGGVGWEQCWK